MDTAVGAIAGPVDEAGIGKIPGVTVGEGLA
jgi:hypothetical protein